MVGSIDEIRGSRDRALLRGADCHAIGAVDAIAQGSLSIALSLGGSAKRYEHTDPNEDIAAFASGPFGQLMMVADGHSGAEAAEAAVWEVLRRLPERLAAPQASIVEGWKTFGATLLADAQRAILAAVARGTRDTARTTLSFALVCPEADALCFVAMGDSHIFRVGSLEAVDIGLHPDPHANFLGRPEDPPESMAELGVLGVDTLEGTRAVLLATDGLSERGIGVDLAEATVVECANASEPLASDLRPLALARGVVQAALDAHTRHRAGDNVATAAWWPAG